MIEELPPHVRALIAAERAAPTGNPAAQAALRARIAATTAGAAKLATAKLVIVALLAGAAVIGAVVASRDAGDEERTQRIAPIDVAAQVDAAVVEPIAQQVDTAVVGPVAAQVDAALAEPAEAAPQEVAPRRGVAPPSTTLPSRATTTGDLSEAALLAAASNALRDGDPQTALALAASHAQRFPRGDLAEERDVVRIEALLATGRRDEARTSARAFRERYPDSIHRHLIDRTLEESP